MEYARIMFHSMILMSAVFALLHKLGDTMVLITFRWRSSGPNAASRVVMTPSLSVGFGTLPPFLTLVL